MGQAHGYNAPITCPTGYLADNTDVKTYAELFATQTGVLSDALDVRRGTATILNDGFTASLSEVTRGQAR